MNGRGYWRSGKSRRGWAKVEKEEKESATDPHSLSQALRFAQKEKGVGDMAARKW